MREHRRVPDHTHLPKKGDNMAVSKNTCKSDKDTNQLLQHFFRNSQVSSERERAWKDAVRHAGTGPSPLRFPVYEVLYSLSVQAQKMVELLEDVTGRFALNHKTSLYHQSLIQYVRAEVSRDLVKSMARSSTPNRGFSRACGAPKRRTSSIRTRSTSRFESGRRSVLGRDYPRSSSS